MGSSRKFFEAPKLPLGYRPVLILVPINVSNLTEKVLKVGENLTPFERARFLGDRANSVMELLSEKDRKFLKQIQENKNQKIGNIKQNKLKNETFEPFEEEPMKNHRFKQFVLYLKRGYLFKLLIVFYFCFQELIFLNQLD